MITRFLRCMTALTLAAICLTSAVACGRGTNNPNDTSASTAAATKAETADPSHFQFSDKPRTAIFNYVKANRAALDTVAQTIISDKAFAFYYFHVQTNAPSTVEELASVEGELIRRPIDRADLNALAETRLSGQLTYSSGDHPDVVSCCTALGTGTTVYYFVYCPDEAAVDYLKNGFIGGTATVDTELIEGNWYYMTAQNGTAS